MKGRVAFLFAVLLAPAVSAQGIYKWVDADGQVHYGERPPGDAPAAEMAVKTTPAPASISDQDRKESTQRVLRAFEEERVQKAEQADKAAKEAAQRKRDCVRAKDRLRSFQEAGYLYDLDKTGERRVLNEAEHAAAMKRVEAEVTKHCR